MTASTADETAVRQVRIVNQRGLHARASARFVQLAARFQSQVHVEKDGIRVGGTSIMGLMMLAASPGCTVILSAKGVDAGAALDALEDLIESRFGEEL